MYFDRKWRNSKWRKTELESIAALLKSYIDVKVLVDWQVKVTFQVILNIRHLEQQEVCATFCKSIYL